MSLFDNFFAGHGTSDFDPDEYGPVARFIARLHDHFGSLWLAGMLTSLACVPVILSARVIYLYAAYPGMVLVSLLLLLVFSVPANLSLLGLHAVTVLAIRREPYSFRREYWKAIRGNWRQAIPAGMFFVLLVTGGCMALWGLTMEEGKGNLLILAAVLAQLFVTVSVWLFSSLQMLYVELTPGQNLKNSLLLTFGYLKSSIPAGLIILAGGGLMLLMFPMISFLLAFFCLPGIVALIADLCVWPAMEESFDISLKLREKRE